MALATRAETSESEAAIADKVRCNTQRVLEAAKAGNLLPRSGLAHRWASSVSAQV